MQKPILLIFAFLLSALITLGNAAQPAHLTRVLHRIDFEERKLGNNEAVPMNWVKVVGPPFPHYVNGRLTNDRAHGGEFSFRFDLNGGSLNYRYEPKQIKITPGASYRLEAWISTTQLQHARARLTGYFTDLDDHPIKGSVRHTEPYASNSRRITWEQVRLDMNAASNDAAYLVIELELLQPDIFKETTLGERALFSQDIQGTAWFDDITISQIPHIRLSTGKPGNLFGKSDPVSVKMVIHDAFTDDLSVQMVVKDAIGKTVYQRSNVPETTVRQQSPRQVELLLPDLPVGWYETSITTSSQGQFLGTQTLTFVKLSQDQSQIVPDERFGLIATDMPFETWNQLPAIMANLGAGRIKLGVWTKMADAERLDPGAFDFVLTKLRSMGIRPTACLLDLPPTLIKKLKDKQTTSDAGLQKTSTTWLQILKAKDEDWHPALQDLIVRHAAHLDRWQLGPDGSDAFATMPEMRLVYNKVYRQFDELLRNPDLAMPWPAWYDLEKNLPPSVALSLPSSVLPQQLPLYIQDLKGQQGHQLSLSLQPLDRNQYSREVQIRDLAQRVVYALAAGVDRIDLPCPFGPVGNTDNPEEPASQQPLDLFPVVRTLLDSLNQAKYVGKIPIAEGIEAFLFDRSGQGILVLWDTGRVGQVRELSLNLGDVPRMFDLYGNDIPIIRPVSDANAGTVHLLVGPTPVFVTNIDGYLAQLRATIGLDKPLIESTTKAHNRKLHLKNPYPMRITGTYKLKAPKGWTITPSIEDFNLNPGEEVNREITIEFPMSSPAGLREIEMEVVIQSDHQSKFTMPLAVKLGLSEVGMQTMAFRQGKDVIVQQIIQNYSEKPIDYTAFAIFPEQTRQERLVINLGPGKSVIKRYRFTKAIAQKGAVIRTGLKELDGNRILNDEIEIP